MLRLWFGRSCFVLSLSLIAIILSRIIVIGTFDFTTFSFNCLSDFKFLKIVNGTLKIKLIEFNIRTKNGLPAILQASPG